MLLGYKIPGDQATKPVLAFPCLLYCQYSIIVQQDEGLGNNDALSTKDAQPVLSYLWQLLLNLL